MTPEQEKKIELYSTIISKVDGVELKGKTMPYTSANGHMFSQLNKDGEIGIRLSKERNREFIEKGASEFRSYGAVMKDYILISDDMLDHPDKVAELLKEGFDHVTTLPPQ